MHIKLLLVGKTDQTYLEEGIHTFVSRINRYLGFEQEVIQVPKKWSSLSEELRKVKEGEVILEHMTWGDTCILLDERGKQMKSTELAAFLQGHMNRSTRKLLFIVGGPYGFSQAVHDAAHMKLSLSKMTFSHQMVRLFFVEQLYRALSIIRNEPYHHQ